jgi:hypothetical protein
VSHSLDLEASVEMSSLCVEQEMASIVIKLVTGLQEIVILRRYIDASSVADPGYEFFPSRVSDLLQILTQKKKNSNLSEI